MISISLLLENFSANFISITNRLIKVEKKFANKINISSFM